MGDSRETPSACRTGTTGCTRNDWEDDAMKFALIIIYVGYKLGGITSIEFENKEACERGKEQIAAHFSGDWGNEAANLRRDNLLCVQTSAP